MKVALSLLASVAGVALVLVTAVSTAHSREIQDGEQGDPINGRRVFLRENCYSCHGGRGGGGMCPSLREDKPGVDDVFAAVLEGTESGMPSFRGRVTDQEIRDLAAYIQSLRTSAEPTFTHWWEPFPSQ